jgi:hypothetical protein
VSPKAWLLSAWVVTGAALLFAHAVVTWQGLSAKELSRRARLAALVPPLAPLVAWRAGHRIAPIAWATLLLSYATLRCL